MKPYGGNNFKTACEERGRKKLCRECRMDLLKQKQHRNDRALQKQNDKLELEIAAKELCDNTTEEPTE